MVEQNPTQSNGESSTGQPKEKLEGSKTSPDSVSVNPEISPVVADYEEIKNLEETIASTERELEEIIRKLEEVKNREISPTPESQVITLEKDIEELTEKLDATKEWKILKRDKLEADIRELGSKIADLELEIRQQGGISLE